MPTQKKVNTNHQSSDASHLQATSSKFFLLGFLAICIITALSVLFMNVAFKNAPTAADKDGVPELWANAYSPSGDITASVETRKYDDVENPFIEYRFLLTNFDSSRSTYLTHFSAYIASDTNKGFVPLTSDSLEYTYTPEADDSWKQLPLSAPANSTSGFRLTDPLALGASGTPFSTLYLRYNVAYNTASDTAIDAKLSAVTTPDNSSTPTLTTTAVAIGQHGSSNEIAISDDPAISSATLTENPLSDETGYTAPLGVSSSFTPGLSVIGSVLPEFQLDSYAFLGMGQIVLLAAIAVLVISLIVYLVTLKRPAKSQQKSE